MLVDNNVRSHGVLFVPSRLVEQSALKGGQSLSEILSHEAIICMDVRAVVFAVSEYRRQTLFVEGHCY